MLDVDGVKSDDVVLDRKPRPRFRSGDVVRPSFFAGRGPMRDVSGSEDVVFEEDVDALRWCLWPWLCWEWPSL